MVGSGLSNGAYITRDVIQEMESTEEDMDSRVRLEPRDHAIVGLYSVLIFCAVKYALLVSGWAWFLVWMNVWFFDVYAYTRKNAQR